MSNLIRRIADKINRLAGVSIEQVYVYSLTKECGLPDLVSPPGLQVQRLERTEMALLQQAYSAFDLAELDLPQRQNSQCYAAFLTGQLVHYSWVQASGPHKILEAGRSIDVAPGEFWIYDCRTIPSVRGMGIYPFMLARIARDQFEQGAQEGLIYTTKENLASQAGIRKAGFTMIKTMRGLRIGQHFRSLGVKR